VPGTSSAAASPTRQTSYSSLPTPATNNNNQGPKLPGAARTALCLLLQQHTTAVEGPLAPRCQTNIGATAGGARSTLQSLLQVGTSTPNMPHFPQVGGCTQSHQATNTLPARPTTPGPTSPTCHVPAPDNCTHPLNCTVPASPNTLAPCRPPAATHPCLRRAAGGGGSVTAGAVHAAAGGLLALRP
jgi:hypothetical protein